MHANLLPSFFPSSLPHSSSRCKPRPAPEPRPPIPIRAFQKLPDPPRRQWCSAPGAEMCGAGFFLFIMLLPAGCAFHGIGVRSRSHKHHRRSHHAPPPSSSLPPEAGCSSTVCTEPMSTTPIGSPCGCVLPLSVIIDLHVAPYLLFMHIAELEVEVAAGTFLKQSQVKIMAAIENITDGQKTRVTVYLVPLREHFDSYTAYLISDRFWNKKIQINSSVFGDYEVINITYPGLGSAPPSISSGLVSGPPGKGEDPITADVDLLKKKKLDSWIIIVASGSSLALIMACIGLVILGLKWIKLKRLQEAESPAITPAVNRRHGGRSILSTSLVSSASASMLSTVATCAASVKTFSLAQLEKATDGFNSRRILGQGGFGCVYHGTMDDGNEIAVKLLTREDRSGDREFVAEVEMLSRLHHRNLVKLIGICIERTRRCLVYELIRNGSVESHLHGADKDKGMLNWDVRMKIALGAARGLAYLHEDSNPHVIHRDFKGSNILLEEDFTPKVTDFGLAREATNGILPISTRVMGTFGYVAPEYAMTGHLLVKSDVYSYGVVLLELLSGRKPVGMSDNMDPQNLVTWACPLLSHKEGLERLIDPSLNGNFNFDNVAKVASIASVCVHGDPSQRPFMGEVVQALKLIYNEAEEACGDSYSNRDSSCDPDDDRQGGFIFESGSGSWWNSGASGCLDYRNSPPFINMEYSSDRIERRQEYDYHSVVSTGARVQKPAMHSRSAPLRIKKLSPSHWSRGSFSEHGWSHPHH
ncbi:hypothetical protein BRADI_3g55237v3 [Brachypodium distachyon]|uniref:Protein kinase domain-containing protein n=1 Tax=Brachypodium distachyon TaxID=15368 RepID=A0A2K2D575_BRADI|nr:hypothetical protein BRADI_3g55237v3 [Brachypodium distachyon]